LANFDSHFAGALDWIDAIDDRSTLSERIRGSTSEFMYMTNGFLFGGIVLAMGLRFSCPALYLSMACILSVLGAIAAQYKLSHWYVRRIEEKVNNNSRRAAHNTQNNAAQVKKPSKKRPRHAEVAQQFCSLPIGQC
jgi:hypothetical protein